MKHSIRIGRSAVAVTAALYSAGSVNAATTVLIAKEGVNNIAEISTVSTNSTGGFATKINLTATGNNGTATIFGSATRTTGTTLRTEGTVGGFGQLNFFSPTINDLGQLGYTSPGASSTTAAFIGDTLQAATGQVIATGPFTGKYFGTVSGAFISTAGNLTYTADTRDASTGNPTGRAIFVNGGTTALLKTGDTISNAGSGASGSGNVIVAPAVAADNASVVLDTSSISQTSISPAATHYLAVADVGRDIRVPTGGTPAYSTQSPNDDLVLVVDGSAATLAGGGIARKGETIPALAGGRVGETIRGFSSPQVNNSGKVVYAVSGQIGTDSATDDYSIVVNNTIVAREHTSYNGVDLGDIGLSPSLDLNENGDFAFSFGTRLFVNGTLVISAGDLVDTDGDNVPDAALSGNIATQGLALSDRLPDGSVDVYFTGRTAAGTTDYLFRTNIAVPEPTTLGLASIAAIGCLKRRRRA